MHPRSPSLTFAVVAGLLTVSCDTAITVVDPPGGACLDVRWPLAIPFGAGPPPADEVESFYPPTACDALADCPPGAYCIEGRDGVRRCQTQAPPAIGGTLAERYGVPRFDLEVTEAGEGHLLGFKGLPPLADFALCSFYSCPVDAELLAEDAARCLLDTVSVDLNESEGLYLPPASNASRGTHVEQTSCAGEPLRVTPSAFAVICIAYRPSGMAAASEIIELYPEQIGAIAGDTYQTNCSDETMGSACPHDRRSAHRLGICVRDYCCSRCATSLEVGSLLERSCASVSRWLVDEADHRYVQMGFSLYGVCLDNRGRAVCLDDDFVPTDAPDNSCVPRAEPRMDDPAPRDFDEDGDGVSVDLDCDDRDPTRGAITFEATHDGVDQDCDGRVDEVPLVPCPIRQGMVVAPDGMSCIDRYEASRPSADASSSGQSADARAPLSRPGVMPWVGVTYATARAACAAAGKSLCAPEVFRRGCLHPSGSPFPYGPDYDADACNGADGLFGALMPTGTLVGCVGQTGAVDMVGNASEWVEGNLIMGGSYRSGTAELSCQPAWSYDADFAPPWVGFRCCLSAAEEE